LAAIGRAAATGDVHGKFKMPNALIVDSDPETGRVLKENVRSI
jgi:hypothetical protein